MLLSQAELAAAGPRTISWERINWISGGFIGPYGEVHLLGGASMRPGLSVQTSGVTVSQPQDCKGLS